MDRQELLRRYTNGERDFRRVDLSGANLIGVNLSGANLSKSQLDRVNLSRAILKGTNLRNTKLNGAILERANLYRAVLHHANLKGTNFRKAVLKRANLYKADLRQSNLSRANLMGTSLLYTQLNGVTLTGACIEDWHTNSQTNLNDVICDYVYLRDDCQEKDRKKRFKERRPHDPNKIFVPGEFTKLFQKALETVDLIFNNGIDWQAFLSSFQKLQVECNSDELSIHSFENKGDGTFVIRVNVPSGADKAEIERYLKRQYQLEAQLEAKSEQLADLTEITKLLASQPIHITQSQGDTTMTSNPGGFSISNSKDVQVVQGNNNSAAEGDNNQIIQNATAPEDEQLTPPQVIELVAFLEERIQALETLPEADKAKSIKRLETAKVKLEEAEPDKEFVAKSLKRVNETLNEASETAKGVKELVKEVAPTAVKIGGWLGNAAKAVGGIWTILP